MSAQLIIKFYQILISPVIRMAVPHSACRFHPTCSEYCHEAFIKYGFILGTKKSLWRILKCNPLTKGGVDLA